RPSRTICCTRASISALVPSTLNLGAVSAGRRATSGGKSHSWLRPTSQSLRPSALTISVALAIKLTTRRRGWDGTIGSVVVMNLLNHLVGDLLEMQRHLESQCLGGVKVDCEVILRRCLHRHVGWLLALESAVDVAGRAAVHVDPIRPIRE